MSLDKISGLDLNKFHQMLENALTHETDSIIVGYGSRSFKLKDGENEYDVKMKEIVSTFKKLSNNSTDIHPSLIPEINNQITQLDLKGDALLDQKFPGSRSLRDLKNFFTSLFTKTHPHLARIDKIEQKNFHEIKTVPPEATNIFLPILATSVSSVHSGKNCKLTESETFKQYTSAIKKELTTLLEGLEDPEKKQKAVNVFRYLANKYPQQAYELIQYALDPSSLNIQLNQKQQAFLKTFETRILARNPEKREEYIQNYKTLKPEPVKSQSEVVVSPPEIKPKSPQLPLSQEILKEKLNQIGGKAEFVQEDGEFTELIITYTNNDDRCRAFEKINYKALLDSSEGLYFLKISAENAYTLLGADTEDSKLIIQNYIAEKKLEQQNAQTNDEPSSSATETDETIAATQHPQPQAQTPPVVPAEAPVVPQILPQTETTETTDQPIFPKTRAEIQAKTLSPQSPVPQTAPLFPSIRHPSPENLKAVCTHLNSLEILNSLKIPSRPLFALSHDQKFIIATLSVPKSDKAPWSEKIELENTINKELENAGLGSKGNLSIKENNDSFSVTYKIDNKYELDSLIKEVDQVETKKTDTLTSSSLTKEQLGSLVEMLTNLNVPNANFSIKNNTIEVRINGEKKDFDSAMEKLGFNEFGIDLGEEADTKAFKNVIKNPTELIYLFNNRPHNLKSSEEILNEKLGAIKGDVQFLSHDNKFRGLKITYDHPGKPMDYVDLKTLDKDLGDFAEKNPESVERTSHAKGKIVVQLNPKAVYQFLGIEKNNESNLLILKYIQDQENFKKTSTVGRQPVEPKNNPSDTKTEIAIPIAATASLKTEKQESNVTVSFKAIEKPTKTELYKMAIYLNELNLPFITFYVSNDVLTARKPVSSNSDGLTETNLLRNALEKAGLGSKGAFGLLENKNGSRIDCLFTVPAELSLLFTEIQKAVESNSPLVSTPPLKSTDMEALKNAFEFKLPGAKISIVDNALIINQKMEASEGNQFIASLEQLGIKDLGTNRLSHSEHGTILEYKKIINNPSELNVLFNQINLSTGEGAP